MASVIELAPSKSERTTLPARARSEVEELVGQSLGRLQSWIETHQYLAYEPFDGLSSPLRTLTFGSVFLDRLLMQAVRQSPINLRPLAGIKPLPSTKGRGYMAAGYVTLYKLTADPEYRRKAVDCLEWLSVNTSPKFAECSWANHFDFASRGGRYSKHESIIVWTSIIGHAFLDAFEEFGDERFVDVAMSASRWILSLPRESTESGTCISYHAIGQSSIHNANLLGAGFLARCWYHQRTQELLDVATEAVKYSCSRQHPNGAWWYAEAPRYHWIDSFHTGYNLDSLQWYIESVGDDSYRPHLLAGLEYYKNHFFLDDGCPRYYHSRTQPIDSQCAAQAIETLANLSVLDKDSLALSVRVARWTIEHMQDRDGHFYYRKYPLITAKAPMFHWAQATTFRALALLLARLTQSPHSPR